MLTIPWLSPTNWYPGVAYTADIPSSTVYHENSVYVCVHSHYSGPVFEPGNWQVILTSGYAEAAQEAEENAQEYMTAAGESALAAAGSAEAAASSASVANFAMSQYSTTALVFATTSAGLAGTVVGRYFSVVSSDPDVFADLYLHSVGPVATFVKSYPSASGIAQILSDIADLQASGNVGTSDIADGAVTLAKMAARAEGTLVGRAAGAGSGTPQELTATQVRAILNVESGADVTDTANVTAAGALMESDVTSLSGVKTLVVPDDTTISSLGRSLVDDTTQAEMRTTLGLGALATKTVVATADIVDDAVTSDKIADGAIGGASLANGVVTNAKMADMVAATLKGRAQSSGTGAPVDLTVSQARVMLGVENVDNTSDANKPISVATGAALDLKVSTSELVAERVARDAADVSSDSRPGECLALWSSTMTGDPTSRVPMSLGTIVDGAEGRSLRLTGADADPGTGYVDVGPRAAFAVELDRVYRVRMVILRVTNPTDPEGHAVELRARNLGAAKSGVSDVTLAPSISPVVADGRVEVSVLVCRGTPPAGVTAYAPPGTARYITPFVRVYGNGHALDVIAVEWVDVTEIQESVSDLQSLESSLGDLALLGQVTNDEIADGAVYGDAIADSAVTNAKLAGMAEARIKGRAAGAGTGAPVDLDATQARALLSLTNVDNTSDANKPISSATAAALALLAPLASPSLTGTPTAPTASPGTNTTQVATTAFARAAVDLAVATLEAALDAEAFRAQAAEAATNRRTAPVQAVFGDRLLKLDSRGYPLRDYDAAAAVAEALAPLAPRLQKVFGDHSLLIDQRGYLLRDLSVADPDLTGAVAPIIGDTIYLVDDEPLRLQVDNIWSARRDDDPAIVTVSAHGGGHAPVVLTSDSQIDLQAIAAQPQAQLTIRRRGTTGLMTRDLTVRRALTPVGAAPRIMIIGDSTSNRQMAARIGGWLSGWGVSPSWIGTINGVAAGSTAVANADGPLGEAREGWAAWGDFLHAAPDGDVASVLAAGGEAAYLAEPKTARQAINPFVRPATGGDAPGIIHNGHVFDFANYLNRFGFYAPHIVVIGLGWNDVTEAGAAGVEQAAVAFGRILDAIRAVGAGIEVVFWLPAVPRSRDGDAAWAACYGAMTARLVEFYLARRAAGDGHLHLVHVWLYQSLDAGWTASAGSTDAATGFTTREITDYRHVGWAGGDGLALQIQSHALAQAIAVISEEI